MKAYEIVSMCGFVITTAMAFLGITCIGCIFFIEGVWFWGTLTIGVELLLIGFLWQTIREERDERDL